MLCNVDAGSEEAAVAALVRLEKWPVTLDELVSSGVGKGIRGLKRSSCAPIAAAAAGVLDFWKEQLQTTQDK